MMCRRVARAIAFDYGNARRTSRHRAGTDSAAVYIVALKTGVYELCTLTGIRTMCTLSAGCEPVWPSGKALGW